jgi:hypothetical protein
MMFGSYKAWIKGVKIDNYARVRDYEKTKEPRSGGPELLLY